jgi:hypothetical protein
MSDQDNNGEIGQQAQDQVSAFRITRQRSADATTLGIRSWKDQKGRRRR